MSFRTSQRTCELRNEVRNICGQSFVKSTVKSLNQKDLWNTSPLLCQLSYAVRSVRVCDISELSLVPQFRNIAYSNRPDRVAQLAEQWASIPKVVGSNPSVVRHIFQACPVWIYTQSNITQASYSPEYITPTQQISLLIIIIITCISIAPFPIAQWRFTVFRKFNYLPLLYKSQYNGSELDKLFLFSTLQNLPNTVGFLWI